MYSSSPITRYVIKDRRPTLGTTDSLHQQQQEWDPQTMLKLHQETDTNYKAHHGYNVTPTPTSSPLPYNQHYLSSTQPLPSKQQISRAVIPSKRAAQNRAAQKAFRQRRDQYVKDLEKKSKEMDHWKQELDGMKNENRQLRTLVHQLEQRISSLTHQPNNISPASSSSSSSTETSVLSPSMPSPRSPSLPTLTTSSLGHHSSSSPSPTSSPLLLEQSSTIRIPSPSLATQCHHSSLLPISLRPHSFIPFKDESPTIPCTSPSSSIPFVAVASAGHATASTNNPLSIGHTPLFELDLDPFFDDDFGFPRIDDQLDFVGHTSGGQVLDDLFAMLQTRQRPQIPLQPLQQQNDQSSSAHYYMTDHVIPSQPSPST